MCYNYVIIIVIIVNVIIYVYNYVEMECFAANKIIAAIIYILKLLFERFVIRKKVIKNKTFKKTYKTMLPFF